jgi:hypothetical protein
MGYHLIDLSNKENDFQLDNLIIGKKIPKDQDSAKYYIYYQAKEFDSPREIYIKLPKIRLIYNLANHKFNQLSIPIYPNCDITDNFINFIKTLENYILELFKNIKNKREFSSILNKKNSLNFLKANINDKLKISSDIEHKNISPGKDEIFFTRNEAKASIGLHDFKVNGQIEMVIRISNVWYNKTKYGLSSELYQIKYWAPPEQLDINFIDEEPPKVKFIPLPPTININNSNYNMNNMDTSKKIKIELPPQIKPSFIPSMDELQKSLKKLKPVSN